MNQFSPSKYLILRFENTKYMRHKQDDKTPKGQTGRSAHKEEAICDILTLLRKLCNYTRWSHVWSPLWSTQPWDQLGTRSVYRSERTDETVDKRWKDLSRQASGSGDRLVFWTVRSDETKPSNRTTIFCTFGPSDRTTILRLFGPSDRATILHIFGPSDRTVQINA